MFYGEFTAEPVHTHALLTEWASWMKAAGMSQRTIADRVQLVARFERSTMSVSTEVAWSAIAEFLGSDEFQPGTRQTYHAHLRTWFAWLTLFEYRVDDPMAKLRAPRAPRRRPRPVSPEQLSRMLCTPMHFRTMVMILLAAYAGLRVSEIAPFAGDQIAGTKILVVGKGGVISDVPLHDAIACIAPMMPSSGYWFPSHTRPGQPIHGNSVSAIIGNVMRRAGVPGTPHALRHFFGTENLRSSGGNIRVVQELMRHANIASAAIYTEVDDTARRKAVAGLPPAVGHVHAA